MMRKFLSFLACSLLLLLSAARADTSLSVDIGWGGHTRPHRWIPVMVTASDPKTRNVELEVYWPHGGNYAMRVRQVFAIGPTPATFPLVLPSHSYFSIQEAVFTVRDPSSGKTLARFPQQPGAWAGVAPLAGNDSSLVGVSGRRSMLDSLRGNLNSQQMGIDYLPPGLLPTAALGYDSLDLLVLNQANLSVTGGGERNVDPAQQQAILDWVRAGGNLIAWPSAVVPFPSSSPLVDVFPCRMGERKSLGLTSEELQAAGLSPRFSQMAVFDCVPEPGAQAIQIFNGHVTAYAKRFGLGRIVVVPLCMADLLFDDADKGRAPWEPLVNGMHVLPRPASTQPANPQPAYGNGYSLTRDDQKETAAAMNVADRLGNVPGAGEFGFAYVVIALAGMMIVVGPVDWWVLKKLGRQPWTWVTTSGWILLVTFAAISVGYLFKSGDLHYRTFRLVDQVGDASVASIECAGIYSPRTRQYTLAADPESWWQPSGVEDFGSRNAPMELDFHQTYQGNTPEPMGINVWSLRFLRGDEVGVAPPMLTVSLTRYTNPDHIVGVIKNLTDRPLKNIRIRTGRGAGDFSLYTEAPSTAPTSAPTSSANDGLAVAEIAPFGTVRVDAVLTPVQPVKQATSENPVYYYNSYKALNDQEIIDQLDMRRGPRIAEILSSGDRMACIYAESVNPAAPVRLLGQNPIEQHFQYIRALVELKEP